MKYFFKIHKTLQAKNKLQQEIQDFVRAQNHTTLGDDEQVKAFVQYLEYNVAHFNSKHPRCKSETINAKRDVNSNWYESIKGSIAPEMESIATDGSPYLLGEIAGLEIHFYRILKERVPIYNTIRIEEIVEKWDEGVEEGDFDTGDLFGQLMNEAYRLARNQTRELLSPTEERVITGLRDLIDNHEGWECGQALTAAQFVVEGRPCQVRIELQYDQDEFEKVWNKDLEG